MRAEYAEHFHCGLCGEFLWEHDQGLCAECRRDLLAKDRNRIERWITLHLISSVNWIHRKIRKHIEEN